MRYLTEHQNTGIAHALNQIMTEAKEDGYTWVVTFDQDSIIPKGMKTAYESNIGVDKDIAIVCPQVIDKEDCTNRLNWNRRWSLLRSV